MALLVLLFPRLPLRRRRLARGRRGGAPSRCLVGSATGLAAGSAAGAALGTLVGMAGVEPQNLKTGMEYGAQAGLCGGAWCGMVAGVVTVLIGRFWIAALLGLALGSLLGGFYAAIASPLAARADEIVRMGMVAGVLDALLVVGIVARMRRGWRRAGPAAVVAACWVAGRTREDSMAPPSAAAESLRRRIRRAGRWTLSLRFLLPVTAGVGYMALRATSPELLTYLVAPGDFVTAFAVSLPAGFLLAALYRRARRRQIGRQLGALDAGERAAVLAPLADPAVPHTYEIVAPFLRELGAARGELVPAAAPGGSEREVSPAGAPDCLPGEGSPHGEHAGGRPEQAQDRRGRSGR